MKRQVKRIALMTTGLSLSLCSMLPKQATARPASEVNVNINIGPPPPVVVQARPTMIYLQEPAAYVAVGIPYDIYFVSGRYYYLHGRDWFWGNGYNGPWTVVSCATRVARRSARRRPATTSGLSQGSFATTGGHP